MRSDYRKLVLFIKAYYEWAETQGNAGFVNSNIDSAIDIDNNLEQFYSHFKSTFLNSFPEIFATNTDGLKPNKKTLLKKIKQFYGSKGTESAYRFLFRLLFDSSVQFYYPKNDILRASDGKWAEQVSIKVTRNNETLHKYAEGGKVQQYKDLYTLQAYATIDRVFQYYQDGVPITELYLTDLVGNFLPNGEVVLTPADSTVDPFTETTFSVLGDFYIQTAGSNYNVGDVVYLQGDGTGFSAKVQQTGLDGAVKRIQIENSGINYVNTISAIVISSNGVNTNAQIVFTPSAITRYPGYYKGNTGKISSTPKIYDGDYYQEFSYELKSAVSIDRFYSALKQLVHPAGMKMFGSILLEGSMMCRHVASSQLTREGVPVLGNYLPYTFGTTLDLRNNGITAAGNWVFQEYGITYGTTGDLYPAGYNPYIGSTAELGPNGLTAPVGTTFTAGGSGGKLGYTYCFVPEGGTVAHRPLGAPLGGITAWLLGNESRLGPDVVGNSPFGLVGLTLWLKPENIGVCGGALATGRSMDIWRDASLSQNHALPPKWDSWTTLYSGVTIDKLRPTLVINDRGFAGRTGIQFNGGVLYGPHTVWTQAGLCGGYVGVTLGAISGISFGPGTIGEKILSGQHFRLTRGISLTKDMSVFVVFRAGTTASGYTASNYGLGLASSSKRLADFSPAVENARTNLLSNTSDLSNKTNWPDNLAGSGQATNRTYGVSAPDGNATATRIVLSIGTGTAISDWCLVYQSQSSWSVGTKYGGFIWMRSTSGNAIVILRHASIGVYQTLNLTPTWQKFYIPQTAISAIGDFQFGLRGTYGTSSTATVDVWQPQLFSGWGLTPFTSETDHLLYHRSYSDIDADSTKQNSTYYFVNSGTNESFYPYESGLVGLRSNTGSTTASRIAFSPYRTTTTGVSLENISLGEWRRNSDGRIQSFYNGEESTNYSVETARRIARPDSPGGSNVSNFAASEVSYNGATLDVGQFGAFCLPVLDSSYAETSANFVTAALANTPYSFKGVIYEILVYDRVLDQSERLLVYSYLSRKYRLDASLGQFFEGAGFGCYPAAVAAGFPYWYIAKHPNTAGSRAVPSGMSMGNITIQSLLSLYGLIYKSAGTRTRLANGTVTVLTEDTYDTLGE